MANVKDIFGSTHASRRHYFYKTTNLINGKYYYGIHSCEGEFLEDGYFGSGTLLLKAINKYGRDNFKREVVEEFRTRELASDFEAFVVSDYFVKREDNYNLRTGGDNGFTGVARNWTDEQRKQMAGAAKERGVLHLNTKEAREKAIKSNTGQKRTDETKTNISKAKLGIKTGARPKVTCPHCGKEGGGGVMHRFHFDNCKLKEVTYA